MRFHFKYLAIFLVLTSTNLSVAGPSGRYLHDRGRNGRGTPSSQSGPRDTLDCPKELAPLLGKVNAGISEDGSKIRLSEDRRVFVHSDGRPISEGTAKMIFEAAGKDFVRLQLGCQAFQNLALVDCGERISYLRRHLAKLEPPTPFYAKVAVSPARVIFFGEQHDHKSGQNLLPTILREMKKAEPSVDCLFIEADRKGQPALDNFFAGKATLAEVEKTAGSAGGIYAAILEEARRLGIRLYAMDARAERNRDALMASIVNARQGVCRKSVVHVGLAHLTGASSLAGLVCQRVSCHKAAMHASDHSEVSQPACRELTGDSLELPTAPGAFGVGPNDTTVMKRDNTQIFAPQLTRRFSDFNSVLVVP